MESIINQSFSNHKIAFDFLEQQKETIDKIATIFIKVLKQKGKILLMGNGGSAADAQHLAAEFIGRFKKNRPPLSAIALATNISSLTAIGNDFGYDDIFVRQIEALGIACDVVVGISTSGNSQNIIAGINKARVLGIPTIAFLGNDGGKLKNIVDISLIIPIADTPRIQEMHIFAGHIICEIVENALFG